MILVVLQKRVLFFLGCAPFVKCQRPFSQIEKEIEYELSLILVQNGGPEWK